MKNLLLVISMISVLFLVGCNGNENMFLNHEDNLQENTGNHSQEIENDDKDNENDSIILTDEQKYKISDSYYISGERLSGECLIELSYTTEKYEKHSCVESDGVEFDITCELSEIGTDGMRSTYDVKINGEEIDLSQGYIFGHSVVMDRMVVIDLDESDQYKELLLTVSEGVLSSESIYRLTKDGLKLIFEVDTRLDYLTKVKDKVICTNYSVMTSEKEWITMGYYLYEEGKFKFIDRFATGEKITDENGMLPANFQELEFDTSFRDNSSKSYKNGELTGKYNLISYKKLSETENDYKFGECDIRLTQDAKYTIKDEIDDVTEMLPAGTILEDFEIDFYY